MTPPYPHLIRETAEINRAQHDALGAKGVKRLMREVEAKARAMAKRVGIKRVAVRAKQWDLATLCDLVEYPMYLLGPGAPRIKTPADVLLHYPRARFSVVLEDQNNLDEHDRKWMERLVAQARARGLQSLSPQWAPNVIKQVRAAMVLDSGSQPT